MTNFLTYSNGLVSVNTHRKANAYVTDFDDIVISASTGSDETLVCALDGNELDILDNGSYWNGSDASQGTLDELYNLISGLSHE